MTIIYCCLETAAQKEKSVKLQVLIRLTLANVYISQGSFKNTAYQIKTLENKINTKFITAEVLYLGFKSNYLLNRENETLAYWKSLLKRYPRHLLTKLLIDY